MSSLRTTHIADAADLETAFGPRAESIQLSTAPFSCELVQIRFNAVCVRACDASGGFQLRRRISEDTLVIGYLENADRILENGRPWLPSRLLLVSGRDIDMSTVGPSRIVWIDIDLPALAPADRDAALAAARGTNSLVPAHNARFGDLRAYVTAVMGMQKADAQLLTDAGISEGIESELLLRTQNIVAPLDTTTLDLNPQRKAFSLVHRVERFMWENLEEPLTLESICANTGCRMRTLIYSFKDWFGMGPIAYLKLLRLNAVHRRLKEPRQSVRIFDVAADFGFWHMGHFSTNYKRVFGVTPTQTVSAARSRDK